MKKRIDIKLARFYLWAGIPYAILWVLGNLHNFPGTLWQSIGNNVWRLLYLIVINFIFFEYTVPFVLRKKRYIIYNILLGLLILWIHCIFWAYGMYVWRGLGIELHIYAGLVTFASLEKALSAQMAYSAGSVFFFGIIRHVYNYIKLSQAAQLLRIEKQQAELNYLKSQTNPHFLFNTLNNIYSLAKDKSDLAPESILRLSKILRFMLYEADGAYISVEQELKIISNYIELEKLRYDDSFQINFSYDVEDMKQALPPLLLMPLVENAFKHGASETRDHPFVEIHLSITKRQLAFGVKNSTEAIPGDGILPTGQAGVKENIGLSNLRRQLELLYKDYDLSVQQAEGVFKTILKINLASHV